MEETNEDLKHEWGMPSIGIPSEILFNPVFSPVEKLLYGFIRNLSSQPNGCYATNGYLGKLVGISKNSVSRTISRLKTAKYIIIENTISNGFNKRTIRINNNSKEIYSSLTNLIHKEIKKCNDWHNNEEIQKIAMGLSGVVMGLSPGSTPLLTREYPPTHQGVPPYSPGSTIEEDSERDNKEGSKIVSKETKTDSDKSDCQNLILPLVENKDRIETANNIENKIKPLTRKLKQVVENKTKPVKVSENIKRVLNFWKLSGLIKHSEVSKTVLNADNIVKKLKAGTFFNNSEFDKYKNKAFTEQEIIDAIKNFALACTNYDYQPMGEYKEYLRKKIGIDIFFYNPRAVKDKSLFIKYFENAPVLVKEENRLAADDDPKTTEIIKQFWINKVLGGIVPVEWSKQDLNSFRRASNFLTKFYKSNIKKMSTEFGLKGDDVVSKRNRVELLFEAILNDVNDDTSKISPGWLCSTTTMTKRLPAYLFAQNIIEED